MIQSLLFCCFVQFFLFCGFVILTILAVVLFGVTSALALAIITRVWLNCITPWLDKHFGESGDW